GGSPGGRSSFFGPVGCSSIFMGGDGGAGTAGAAGAAGAAAPGGRLSTTTSSPPNSLPPVPPPPAAAPPPRVAIQTTPPTRQAPITRTPAATATITPTGRRVDCFGFFRFLGRAPGAAGSCARSAAAGFNFSRAPQAGQSTCGAAGS